MFFVSRFKRGNWQKKAQWIASNPTQAKELLSKFTSCLSRKGLVKIKDHLLLVRDYLCDVVTGKYKGYDTKNLILIMASVLYVVTPLDFLPDLIPGGLIDDVSITLWALKETGEELRKYKESKEAVS